MRLNHLVQVPDRPAHLLPLLPIIENNVPKSKPSYPTGYTTPQNNIQSTGSNETNLRRSSRRSKPTNLLNIKSTKGQRY